MAATVTPLPVPEVPRGELVREGDRYHFVAVDRTWALEWARVKDGSDGPTAEVRGVVEVTGRASPPTKVTLTSAQSRATVVKALELRCPGPPWAALFDHVVGLVLAAHRQGEVGRVVVPERPAPDRWLWPGLIPLNGTTVLAGDGGVGKSLFALALAVAAQTGLALAGRYPVGGPAPVLWLDWEDDYRTFSGRLWGLCQPLGLDGVPGLIHRRMHRQPITDALTGIRHDLDTHGAQLVVVDSLAPASGPDPESANAAVQTLDALGALGVTRLVLAHVSKVAADDPSRPARPYGSVFVANLARSVIEAKRQEAVDPDTLTVTYHHRKSNRGGLARPFALEYGFTPEGAIDVRPATPDLEAAGLTAQVLAALRSGAQTATALAEDLGKPATNIRTVLGRLENRHRVWRLSPSGGGRGQETQWGLMDRNRHTDDT